ncbi:MAG: hypothetical protein LBQ79_08930 [Deltaproteobacteria bacterium]|nr:hypothetical protein [Deltaproteobacteria bacterium]
MNDRVNEYQTVAAKRAAAARQLKELSSITSVSPVQLDGATYARGFWSRMWRRHFEQMPIASKRMSRGLSLLRNNAILHFEDNPGRIRALVMGDVAGDHTYETSVDFAPASESSWAAARGFMKSHPVTLDDILAGRLESPIPEFLRSPAAGLLPFEHEFVGSCECSDRPFCIHMAAAVCAVAVRIESDPAFLFRLRGVHPADIAYGTETASAEGAESEPLPLASLDLAAAAASKVVVRRRAGQEQRVELTGAEPVCLPASSPPSSPPSLQASPFPPATAPSPSSPAPLPESGGPSGNGDDEPETPVRPRRPRLSRSGGTRRKRSYWVPVPVEGPGDSDEAAEAAETAETEVPFAGALPPPSPPVPEPAAGRRRRGGRPRGMKSRQIPEDYQFGDLFAKLNAASGPLPAENGSPDDAPAASRRVPPNVSGRSRKSRAAAGTASARSARPSAVDAATTGRASSPPASGRGPASEDQSRAASASPAARRAASNSPAPAQAGARGSTRAATRSASKSEVKTVSTASSLPAPKASASKPTAARKTADPKPAARKSAAAKPSARSAAKSADRKAPKLPSALKGTTSKSVKAEPFTKTSLPPLDFRHVSGKDIRALRRYTGLPLEAFSYKMKICKATLIRWESTKGILGLYTPSVEALKRLYRSLQRKVRNKEDE